jgi:hypothetical protein
MTAPAELSDQIFLQRYGECTLTVEEANGRWLICCPDQINAITSFDRLEDAFRWIGALREATSDPRYLDRFPPLDPPYQEEEGF